MRSTSSRPRSARMSRAPTSTSSGRSRSCSSRSLAGEAIPLAARIIAVCDAYSAMTSDRPYRAAWTAAEAVAELQLEPRQGVALELADALARQAELLADRLERGRLGLEAEAELDDPPLPLGQVRDRALDALPAHRLHGLLGRIDRRLVGEQIAELRVAVRAEALVQGDGIDRLERLHDVLELEPRRV